MESDGQDVYGLTDEELMEMLRERGVDVGPILESTRKVYQLKLQELLSREGGSEGVIIQQLEETYGDEDDEENQDYDPANADTQPVEDDPIPVYRYSPARQPVRLDHGDDFSTTTGTRHFAAEDVTLTRRTLRTTTSETMMSSSRPASDQSRKPAEKKKGRSMCLMIVFFVIVALLIFLVILNMEPAAKDPLQQIDV